MNLYFATWISRRVWWLGAVIALVSASLLFRWGYQVSIVSGNSMLPTLNSGDVLLVDRRAYRQLEPGRGDLVVARHRGDLVVKRIVGLAGEEVEVSQGRLYVNGARVKENHAIYPGRLLVGKGKLLPGDFATLGDNRAIPASIAVHPIVTKADLVGRVVMVFSWGASRWDQSPGREDSN